MGLADYHIHTAMCGHAKGSTDDYIRAAIKNKITEMGFSDHAPLPEGLQDGITMLPEQTEMYIRDIEEKRQTCNDHIQIKIGFEVDFPLTGAFDRKYLSDPRLDYLTGSCHYIGDWAFDNPDHADEFGNRDIDEVYYEYYKIINSLIASGNFNIIGHFDLVKKFGHRSGKSFTEDIKKMARFIAGKNDIAIEINTAGLRKPVSEIYPAEYIVDIFYSANTPVTLGSDAHNPEEVGYLFGKATEMIKRAGYRKISGFSKRRRYDILL